MCKNSITFPIILYVDGHSSHVNLELSNFCKEHKIELICLYPNATHVMQPMDVALFRPLKAAYKDAVRSWRMEHDGQALTKVFFASVLKNALDSIDVKKIFDNRFRRCGLCPFSADGVNYTRLISTSQSSTDNTVKTPEQILHCTDSASQDCSDLFESNIDPDILKEFESVSNSGEWTGPLEYKALYDFWCKCKNKNISSTGQISKNEDNQSKIVIDQSTMDGSDLLDADIGNNESQEKLVSDNILAEIYVDDNAVDGISVEEILTPDNISTDEFHKMNMLLNKDYIEKMEIVHVITESDSSLNKLSDKSIISDITHDSCIPSSNNLKTVIDESTQAQNTASVSIESTALDDTVLNQLIQNDSGFVELDNDHVNMKIIRERTEDTVYDQNIITETTSINNLTSKDLAKNTDVSSDDKNVNHNKSGKVYFIKIQFLKHDSGQKLKIKLYQGAR